MNELFNSRLFFNNILFLLHCRGMRIGELESAVGVSPGYISRMNKEDVSSKPGIDFIQGVASILEVSVDLLVFSDLSALTTTEQICIDFLYQLTKDTQNDKLFWETATSLNNHPLLSEETFRDLTYSDPDMQAIVTENVFKSNTFDVYTEIHGDCFTLEMDGGTMFVMDIDCSIGRASEANNAAREIWFSTKTGNHFLCSNKQKAAIAIAINSLYDAIEYYNKRPHINADVQSIINAYMESKTQGHFLNIPDVEDIDDLPFI